MQTLPRLLFLASQLKQSTPLIPRELQRYIPQYDLILAAREGLQGAALSLGVGVGQMVNLAQQGKVDKQDATPYAFKMCVAQCIFNDEDVDEKTPGEKVKIFGVLDRWVNSKADEMFAYEEADLADDIKDIDFDKWNSGFEPIDIVTEGLYQAVMIIMGNPGTGKTTHMWALAESIKRSSPSTRILFFEIEIPRHLMLARIRPIIARGNPFTHDDLLCAGPLTMEDIMEKVAEATEKYGNHDQIVFIDSPDAMSGPESGERRFDLEAIYRACVRIKTVSKLVVVASQPKRNDGGTLKITSVAESWAKAWYCDIMLGINPIGKALKMKVLKNRFGLSGGEVVYNFDNLNIQVAEIVASAEDDW